MGYARLPREHSHCTGEKNMEKTVWTWEWTHAMLLLSNVNATYIHASLGALVNHARYVTARAPQRLVSYTFLPQHIRRNLFVLRKRLATVRCPELASLVMHTADQHGVVRRETAPESPLWEGQPYKTASQELVHCCSCARSGY